jgi:hypothetical protein
MRLMQIRCEDCYELYAVRRPKNPNLIATILALIKCPRCHPEALKDVCAGCRLPFELFPMHSNEKCGSCVRRAFYWSLGEDARRQIRARELIRYHDARCIALQSEEPA